jgi:hypothetical protein
MRRKFERGNLAMQDSKVYLVVFLEQAEPPLLSRSGIISLLNSFHVRNWVENQCMPSLP